MRWYRAPRGQIPAARGAAGPGKQPRALPGAPRVSLLKGQPRGRKERKRCISPPQNSKSQSFRSTQVSYLPAARGVSEGSSVRGRSGPTWSLQPTARGSSSPLPSPQTPLTRAAPSHSPEDDGSAPAPLRMTPQGWHRLTGHTGTWAVGAGSPAAAPLAELWFLALQSPTPALTCLQQRRSVRRRPRPHAKSSVNQPGWAKGSQPCCGGQGSPGLPRDRASHGGTACVPSSRPLHHRPHSHR